MEEEEEGEEGCVVKVDLPTLYKITLGIKHQISVA